MSRPLIGGGHNLDESDYLDVGQAHKEYRPGRLDERTERSVLHL